jgi:hypothetical protein
MQIDMVLDSRLGPSSAVRPVFGSMLMRTATLRLLMATAWVSAWLNSPAASADAIEQSWLTSPAQLQHWHAEKAAGGPTFSGSPAWRKHMAFVETGLRDRGVVELKRDAFSYQRWYAADDQDGRAWSLEVDGEPMPVASYWAYSGATTERGVSAPLVYFDRSLPAESFRDRIVVFDVPALSADMQARFEADHVYATSDFDGRIASIASDQWYQGNYVTRFGRFDQVLRNSGAAGAVVIFDMSPGRAAGLYTFPLLRPGVVGVPGLYVDRSSGQTLRDAARSGKTAKLKLLASTEDVETYFLSGVLPGRDYGTPADQAVLLVTHSDGPNLTQENGAFGILAVIDYFSHIPQSERHRSLLVLLDPQHYMPDRHLLDWYETHPEVMDRVIASVGIEQLGQRQYAESGAEFGLTGAPEPTLVFVQDNDRLVGIAINAVQASELPRTKIRIPSRGGQGVWAGLGDVAVKRNMPGFAISTDMSGYWSTLPGLESFDADLCHRQVQLLVSLTAALMTEDRDAIGVSALAPESNPALSPGTPR